MGPFQYFKQGSSQLNENHKSYVHIAGVFLKIAIGAVWESPPYKGIAKRKLQYIATICSHKTYREKVHD